MTSPIEVTNYDPIGAQPNPVRTVAGVLNSGDVTPDTDYPYARWLYVGTTGDLNVKKPNGDAQLYQNIIAGVYHPIHSIGVFSADTTATGIVWGS